MNYWAITLCVVLLGCEQKTITKADLTFVEPYRKAISADFNEQAAFNTVKYISQYWRVAGNPGFDSSIAYVANRLKAAGFSSNENDKTFFTYRIDLAPADEKPAWNPISAKVVLINSKKKKIELEDFGQSPVMLCPNSFSTNITVELIDVGHGENDEDYRNKNLKGKIAFGNGAIPLLFLRAVKQRDALGVVSSQIPEYNHADQFPDIISKDDIPYNNEKKSFGLKISRRSERILKEELSKGPCKLHVEIETEFKKYQMKTLIAEIQGTVKPRERIVSVAHIDHYKPGANDNASGSATLLEMALSLKKLISEKKIDMPSRTLTFIWGDEYRNDFLAGGAGFWMRQYFDDFAETKAAFSLDMTGEDTKKTGGTFLIEKYPDPSAVWTRSPDIHSGWGESLVDEARLDGSFINDYVFYVCNLHAKETHWSVKTNVFEGGSDHQPFVDSKIPVVLAWHFPDQFYHSNMDDLDKVSATEMKNVGVSILTAILGVANLNKTQARELNNLLLEKALARLESELDNSKNELTVSKVDKAVELEKQKRILSAWHRWYNEALESVARVCLDPDQSLAVLINQSKEVINQKKEKVLKELN